MKTTELPPAMLDLLNQVRGQVDPTTCGFFDLVLNRLGMPVKMMNASLPSLQHLKQAALTTGNGMTILWKTGTKTAKKLKEKIND